MSEGIIYCLDTNFFIEAWNKYYSPKFCSDYWNVIEDLAKKDLIFIPQAVRDEIYKTDDELSKWLKREIVPVRPLSEKVSECLRAIYAKDEKHKRLVDSSKGRSLADPWVIAHAMNERAIVVTKEEKVTNPGSDKIKIPNVCDAMDVKWMNDFEFIRRMNIQFKCSIVTTAEV